MLSSTTPIARRVAQYSATLKNALRFSRSRCTEPQSDPYVAMLSRDILSRSDNRRQDIERVCALVVDLARRGSLEDAESIGLTLCAIARAEHASAHGRDLQLSVDEAKIAEEQAEGEMQNAEKALDLDPKNVGKMLALLAASAKYSCAVRERDRAVREQVVAA